MKLTPFIVQICLLMFTVNSFGLSLTDNPNYKSIARNIIVDSSVEKSESNDSEKVIVAETFQRTGDTSDVYTHEYQLIQFSLCNLDNDACTEIGEPLSVLQLPVVSQASENNKPLAGEFVGLIAPLAVMGVSCFAFKSTCAKLLAKLPGKDVSTQSNLLLIGVGGTGAAAGYVIGQLQEDNVTNYVTNLITVASQNYGTKTVSDGKGNEIADFPVLRVDSVDHAVNAISAYQLKYVGSNYLTK